MVVDQESSDAKLKRKPRKKRTTSKRRSYSEKIDYFWSQVAKSNEESGCWIFEGTRLKSGYGVFTGTPRHRLAHRFSWKIEHDDVPVGLVVCHACDNPPCVRPSHLFLGTYSDNMMDASSKGRLLTGEDHPRIKNRLQFSTSYTADEDRVIIENYGRVSVEELGRMVGRPWKAVFERVRRLGLRPPTKTCHSCQEEFSPSKLANQKYCTKRCQWRFLYHQRKGRLIERA